MNRRGFFGRLFGAAAAVTVAKVLPAEAETPKWFRDAPRDRWSGPGTFSSDQYSQVELADDWGWPECEWDHKTSTVHVVTHEGLYVFDPASKSWTRQ